MKPRTLSVVTSHPCVRVALFLPILLLMVLSALATDGTWTGSSGNYSDTTKWSSGVVASGTGATATFGSASNTITLDASQILGTIGLSMGNPSWGITFTGSSSTSVLTLATSSGTPLLAINSFYSGNFQWGNMIVAGTQGLNVQTGFNTLVLKSGLNWTASGTMTSLQPAADGDHVFAQGDNVLPGAMDMDVSGGSAGTLLVINGATTQTTGALTGSRSNDFIAAYSGANGLHGGNNPGGTNVLGSTSAATFQIGYTGSSGTFAGVIGKSFSSDSSAAAAALNIVKLGAGTQTFSGTNTYAGTTTVNGGRLLVTGTHTGGSVYAVTSGGTLGGTGTIIPADSTGTTVMVNIQSGGVLRPGNGGSGTLTLNGTSAASPVLAFVGGAKAIFDLSAGLVNGKAAIGGGTPATDVTFNNTVFDFSDLTSGSLTAGQYVLIQGDANTAYGNLTIGGGNVITSGVTIGSGLAAYTGSTLQLIGNNIVLNLVVPASPPPGAPTNVTATGGYNQIGLSWTASSGATSYNVKRSTTSGSGYGPIATGVSGTSYTDLAAIVGTTYYYVVSAVGTGGESANSSETSAISSNLGIGINFKHPSNPGMASGDNAGAVRLSNWNNLTGPSGLGDVKTLSTVADSTGAAVAGMSVSFTGGNTSSGTLNGSGTVNDDALFACVYDQFDGTSSSVTVSGIPYATYDVYFYRSSDGSARAGSFTINGTTYYVRGGLSNPTTSGSGYVLSSDTSYGSGTDIVQGNYVKFTGLTASSFTCTFTAVNGGDGVQRSKIPGFQIVATTGQAPVGSAPPAPANVLFLGGNNQVTLNWASSNTATTYYVKRSADGVNWTTIATLTSFSGNTYVDTTAVNGTTYSYKITAVNGIGQTDSATVGVTPYDSATVRAIGVTLVCDYTPGMAIYDLGGVVRVPYWNNLDGLRITGSPYSKTVLQDNTGTTVPGANAIYTVGTSGGSFITGYNSDLLGNDVTLFSNGIDQFNAGTPGTVTFAGIPYSSYDVYVFVHSDGAARAGSVTVNGVTKYIRGGVADPASTGLGYVESTDTTYGAGTDITQGNYVRFSGQSGSSCTISLNAVNAGDSSQRLKAVAVQIVSNTTVPVVPPSAAPNAPTGVIAFAGNRQVNVSWNGVATATTYKVKRSANSGSGYSTIATVTAPITGYCDLSASNNGTPYYYVVAGTNSVGEGPASTEAGATPLAPSFTPPARSVYQWSIPVIPPMSAYAATADPQRRAYLWIPPGCTSVRGLVTGLQNMLERPLFEDPVFRQACTDASLGIVWIAPGYATSSSALGYPNMALTLDPGLCPSDVAPSGTTIDAEAANELAAIINLLGTESGHSELQYAPIAQVGHSAGSPFAWGRSVYASGALAGRVFALLPYKGTYPGHCPKNIPILHVSNQWAENGPGWGDSFSGDRVRVVNFRGESDDLVSSLNNSLIGEFTQPGNGHYHHSNEQVGPIALFIKKAAQYRIPNTFNGTSQPVLNTIDPTTGYLVDPSVAEPTRKEYGTLTPVSYANWVTAGKNPKSAYWYLDQEMAQAVCDDMNAGFGKKMQMIDSVFDDGTLGALGPTNFGVTPYYATLQPDGVTFKVRATYLTQSPTRYELRGSYLGFSGGQILFQENRSGALRQTGADTFVYSPDRGAVVNQGQPWEPFLIAYNLGNSEYRSADRPLQILNPLINTSGSAQNIAFPPVPNQVATNLTQLTMSATASSGLSVKYWMVSGSYRNSEYDSSILLPDALPAVAKYPMRAVVAAWQWGRPGSAGTALQSASPVFKTFWVFGDAHQKWQYETFGTVSTGTNGEPYWNTLPATAADDADPDGDGLSNLLEYSTGSDPLTFNSGPLVTQGFTGDGTKLTLTFNRIADPLLIYTVQASNSLTGDWTSIWTCTGTSNVAGSVIVADTDLISDHEKRFLRLRISY